MGHTELHRTRVFDRVAVTLFDETPTPASTRAWLSELREASRAAGAKIALIVVIPEGHAAPGPWIAAEIKEHIDVFHESVETIVFALLGEGFSQSIRRSVITGILLAVRSRRGRAAVVSTMDDAVAVLPTPYASATLREAIAREGLDHPRARR
ncbi:MAG: hypothetical protein U0269_28565 [Polyangiales bacterium]